MHTCLHRVQLNSAQCTLVQYTCTLVRTKQETHCTVESTYERRAVSNNPHNTWKKWNPFIDKKYILYLLGANRTQCALVNHEFFIILISVIFIYIFFPKYVNYILIIKVAKWCMLWFIECVGFYWKILYSKTMLSQLVVLVIVVWFFKRCRPVEKANNCNFIYMVIWWMFPS